LGNKDLEKLEEGLKVQHVPDAFFGRNIAQFFHKGSDFLYEFNAFDALLLTRHDNQKALLAKKGFDKTKLVNSINYLPTDIKVKMAESWKDYKPPEDTEIKDVAIIGDWTCGTPYKGTVKEPGSALNLADPPNEIVQKSTLLKESAVHLVEETSEDIPISKLGMDNPILNYNEVTLFEDDLGDCGYGTCFLRWRTMKDCFFALLRSYIRVDDVLIRIMDTRIYHEYGKNYLLREFSTRESTVDELRKMGLRIDAEFILDPKQSDIAYRLLKVVLVAKDKIIMKP
jgi:type 2A phosphatase activator TIP41